MANNPNNIRLGPCRVRWAGRDLGLTKGGVELEVATETKQVTVDQFGSTPVNEYILGRTLTATVPLAETDVDTLHSVLKNIGSTLEQNGTAATGTITITTNPTAGDTVVVNGTTYTFRAAAALPNEVTIGGTSNATAAALQALLQGSSDPNVNVANYSVATNVITVTYGVAGLAGNAFTLAKTGTGVTVSGANLSSGTASTVRRIKVQSGVGMSLYSTAAELTLHPVDKDDNDASEDFVIPLANTGGSFSLAYRTDEERVLNLTFTGYPDPVSKVLYIYGDKGAL